MKRRVNQPSGAKRKRPAADFIYREFMDGLSFVGLARKYGMTSREAQALVRRVAIKRAR